MLTMNNEFLFRKSSTTYYFSSLFFPKSVKPAVFTLYAFVRTADNFVDSIPQDKQGFLTFKETVLSRLSSREKSRDLANITLMTDVKTNKQDELITDFLSVASQYDFERSWIIAFLNAMESDLNWQDKTKIKTYGDLQKYMYGSAEVIGLMMCRILKIPQEAFRYAQKMGESMQLINFVRDISEDLELGRVYLPQEDLKRFGLTTSMSNDKKALSDLIRLEINRYFDVLAEAKKGLSYIPYRYRVPIKTASDMYQWTANQIYKNPLVVFEKKVKPKPYQVVFQMLKNAFLL